jgi:hypothetical protein
LIDQLWVCLLIAGLAIAAFHWLPWPWGELHRVLAYAVGTSVIWLGVFLYLGPSTLFWQLSQFPLVVGVTVLVLKFAGQVVRWAILHGWPWLSRQIVYWLTTRSGNGERRR